MLWPVRLPQPARLRRVPLLLLLLFILSDATASDWTWWNNRDWTANVSRVNSFEKRTFLPTRIREYQIRRVRFPSVTWRLRFELTGMKANNETQEITIYPEGTSDKSTAGWLVLVFPDAPNSNAAPISLIFSITSHPSLP